MQASDYLSGAEQVLKINSLRFLGLYIAKNLSWSTQISTMVKKKKKKQKRLRKVRFQSQIPVKEQEKAS